MSKDEFLELMNEKLLKLATRLAMFVGIEKRNFR